MFDCRVLRGMPRGSARRRVRFRPACRDELRGAPRSAAARSNFLIVM
jgi:hypothetical protein